MNQPITGSVNTAGREIVTTRLLDAPRETVWQAWTDPARIVQWWGPNGFTTTTKQMDVRPGGVWEFIMHGPDGTDYPNTVVYHEIVPPERLVYAHGGGDGPSFQNIITLEARGNQTLLTMRAVFQTAADRDFVIRDHHADEGGKQTLGRLAEYLARA